MAFIYRAEIIQYVPTNGSILFAVPQPNILGGCNNYILDISCGDMLQGIQNILQYQKLNAVHILQNYSVVT